MNARRSVRPQRGIMRPKGRRILCLPIYAGWIRAICFTQGCSAIADITLSDTAETFSITENRDNEAALARIRKALKMVWHCVTLSQQMHYLWRPIDQEGPEAPRVPDAPTPGRGSRL